MKSILKSIILTFCSISAFGQQPSNSGTNYILKNPSQNNPNFKGYSSVVDFSSKKSNSPFSSNPLSRIVSIPMDYNQKTGTLLASLNDNRKLQSDANFENEIKIISGILNSKLNTNVELRFIDKQIDDQGIITIKTNQYFQGVKVFYGSVNVHFNRVGGHLIQGNLITVPNYTKTEAKITGIQAEEFSKNKLQILEPFVILSDKTLKMMKMKQFSSELIIYGKEKPTLTYHVTAFANHITRYEFFIDAINGKIIDYYNNTQSDGPKSFTGKDLNGATKTIGTYLSSSNYYLIDASLSMFNSSTSTMPDDPQGALLTADQQNSTNDADIVQIKSSSNSFTSKQVSAHSNTYVAYNYFKNVHNRNSIDGLGGTILSVINVPDANGKPLDNAHWNGTGMYYGNGDKAFTPLMGSLDVAGHEMTHGVTEKTAALEYKDESGAINESFSDIFGCMMDSADWQIGEDIVVSKYFPTGALRDLSDPHNGGTSFSDNGYQPKKVSEKYTGTDDNGGVHINSGIPNHAFYLFATAIGNRDAASKVFYKALSKYLNKTSNFKDLRNYCVLSAEDLYGQGSNIAIQVGKAFDKVEIYGNSTKVGGSGVIKGSGLTTIKENPGNEFLIFVNLDATVSGIIYLYDFSNKKFTKLSDNSPVDKISTTDNGEDIVFVNYEDSTLHYLGRNSSGIYSEKVIQKQNIWKSVAISKDGNRIAATTIFNDTSIYIYDFVGSTWTKFKLYSPTYSQGVKDYNEISASSLEFTYDGSSVMFTARTKISSFFSTKTEVTIAAIEVWNTDSNKIGSGDVFNLFSNIPEDVNVSHATFAKNAPFVIAYDYYPVGGNTAFLKTTNLENGDTATLFGNIIYNYPDYGKKDDYIYFGAKDNSSNYVIAKIGINSDKITKKSAASIALSKSLRPTLFADGKRDFVTDVPKEIDFMSKQLSIQKINNGQMLLINNNGKTSANLQILDLNGKMINQDIIKTGISNIDLSFLQNGMYIIYLNNGTETIYEKILR